MSSLDRLFINYNNIPKNFQQTSFSSLWIFFWAERLNLPLVEKLLSPFLDSATSQLYWQMPGDTSKMTAVNKLLVNMSHVV